MANETAREGVVLKAQSKNPAERYLGELQSESSRDTMKRVLDAIATYLSQTPTDAIEFPWADLGPEHTQQVWTWLVGRYAHTTANHHLSALRGVLKMCWRLGIMDADRYQRATDLKSVKGKRAAPGRALPGREIHALLRACEEDPSPAGARDAAALCMTYGAGLRRFELVGLRVEDYNPETGRVKIRGKGNKVGYGNLTESARRYVAEWLALRGSEPGALFVPINKAGVLMRRADRGNRRHISGMTARAVAKMLTKRVLQAGLAHVSPHDLRRSFITHLLELTGDLGLAQRRARHASPVTTMRYDRRLEQDDVRMAEVLEDILRKAR